MLITTALIAAVVVAGVGALIFWSNPRRIVNRATFTCSLHIAAWLLFLYFATTPTTQSRHFIWFRCTCAISAWVPLHFWIVKETIAASPHALRFSRLCRGWGWVVASAVLSGVCFTNGFSSTRMGASLSYHAFNVGVLCLYGLLFIDAFRATRRLSGGPRLELQLWLGGGCAMAFALLILLALQTITSDRSYVRMQPLVVLGFYSGTVVAITNNRIFEARQIFMVGMEKGLLVAMTTTFAYGVFKGLVLLMPGPVAIFATVGGALWFALVMNGWLERKLQLFPQAKTVRQAAFDVVRNESRVEKLEQAFVQILKGWGQTDHALMLHGTGESLRGGGIEISADSDEMKTLHTLRWATPERLAREKTTPERELLGKFLDEHRLGIAVMNESQAVNVVVGVGLAISRRPYTYLQVTQLTELMSIFEGAFERAGLSAKAQHAEQLATVGLLGASLAHEIRNPLVSIKTFVQLLPTRHQDPAFRDKFFHLMKDEVARIDRLTEQLLDLASPRSYSAHEISIHPVIHATLELVGGKTSEKRVQVATDLQASPDRAYADESAVKQVLLNLCLNAIQAMEDRPGDRWIKVSTRNGKDTVEMIAADSGPGISPQMHARLFQPFQSTKSSGFGLGLAICRDILTSLNASISVDPPVAGQGATFRVIFPCQRPSS